MTKYYCDRCGKDVGSHFGKSDLKEIELPIDKTQLNNIQFKRVELCVACYQEYKTIINKLVDIRLVLFEDFMRKSEDKE